MSQLRLARRGLESGGCRAKGQLARWPALVCASRRLPGKGSRKLHSSASMLGQGVPEYRLQLLARTLDTELVSGPKYR